MQSSEVIHPERVIWEAGETGMPERCGTSKGWVSEMNMGELTTLSGSLVVERRRRASSCRRIWMGVVVCFISF